MLIGPTTIGDTTEKQGVFEIVGKHASIPVNKIALNIRNSYDTYLPCLKKKKCIAIVL
jgi:hypothetical protein